MKTEDFLKAYNESRNGANSFYYGFIRTFAYSDGVKECFEAGCYWILDIVSTEIPRVLRSAGENLGTFTVTVKKSKAKLELSGSGDIILWKKNIGYTDLPEGRYVFFIADEGTRRTMILSSEY